MAVNSASLILEADHLQYKEQENDGGDLNPPDSECNWITFSGELVEEEAAIDVSIPIHDGCSPIPEEASTDGEDDSRNAKSPDDEINADIPCWVEMATLSDNDENCQ